MIVERGVEAGERGSVAMGVVEAARIELNNGVASDLDDEARMLGVRVRSALILVIGLNGDELTLPCRPGRRSIWPVADRTAQRIHSHPRWDHNAYSRLNKVSLGVVTMHARCCE